MNFSAQLCLFLLFSANHQNRPLLCSVITLYVLELFPAAKRFLQELPE